MPEVWVHMDLVIKMLIFLVDCYDVQFREKFIKNLRNNGYLYFNLDYPLVLVELIQVKLILIIQSE
jgi:hypothetical protein